MTKKTEEKETDKTQKTEEKVVETKKSNNSTSKDELKTLIELVQESSVDKGDIIIELASTDYLKQYYTEERMQREGAYIKPTLSENEFKKIIKE